MAQLLHALKWKRISIPAGAAVGQVELSIGQVGSGGPVALVAAGVHGDEGPWGAWAIRKLLERTPLDDLRGTLRVVPVANPFAMEADARNAPFDTLDLNRTFPGDPKGSHTDRLAAALVENAIDGADVVIDLHGGGSWCVNAFAFLFPGGEDLSRAFAPPFLVVGADRSVTLSGYARSRGAKIAAVEMGGRSEAEEQWAERIAGGLRRALGIAGILSPAPSPETPLPEPIILDSTTVLRPSRGGVFLPQLRAKEVGTIVAGGTLLGSLLDPVTQGVVETFNAPFPKTAILLLRPMLARIEGGAMTYVVGEVKG
jgi:predicted deacylase